MKDRSNKTIVSPVDTLYYGKLLFELWGPDGHEWRLYENGAVEGFPDGTSFLNHAKPYIDALRGRMAKQSIPSTRVTTKET